MSLSRRECLAAGLLAPMLSSCATDLTAFAAESVPDLAARLGICAASWVTLTAGTPQAPQTVSGCPSAPPPPAGAVFQAASLTKPLIAFVALTLARDGRLDMNAPVSRYLPGGYDHRQNLFAGPLDVRVDRVPPSTLARIPVASLLNHSSGLPNWTGGVLAPEFEPGTRWQYSGEAYGLLQAVIGAVTGQDIESAVSTIAFEPLGMRQSRLHLTGDIRSRVVDGRSWFGAARPVDFVEPNAAASLYTTADDYARLMSALLADAALLAMTLARPIPVDPALGLSWGQGWGIATAVGGPCLWQWGHNPGFRAFAMVSTASGKGFVLLTNSERGLALAPPLARSTLPAVHGVFRFPMLN